MAAPVVQIAGLKELRRDLMRLDKEGMPKAFVAAGVAVAEPLAGRVRAALPHRSGDLAGTVRVAKVRTGASLRVGTAGVRYAGPTEFGGYPRPASGLWREKSGGFIDKVTGQPLGGGRPYMAGGRYIFPTARASAAEAVQRYAAEVSKIIEAFSWSQPKAESL